MLVMKPNCECCDVDLDSTLSDAVVCSFECTWCRDRVAHLQHRCPNCGGELVSRPSRSAELLELFPASLERLPAKHLCAR